jgi:hypothetical protein
VTARRVLLGGLAFDAGTFALLSELAPLYPRNDTFPATYSSTSPLMRWSGAGQPDRPVVPGGTGLCERFCPSAPSAVGKTRSSSKRRWPRQVSMATEPDLLDEVASWQADDFWQYAMYTAVACVRAAASRAGVPVRQACQDLGERPVHPP